MKIYADLIPHEKFHKGIWLKTKNVPWYFFFKKDRVFELPKNKKFYETIDLPIKNLVEFLHKNNLPTTPSCSGHFKEEKYYSNIYDKLKVLEKKIREENVILNDVEDNKFFYYKNKNYKLPWLKEEFLNKILDYQKNGVLGIIDNDKIILSKLSGKNYNIFVDDGITIVKTKTNSQKECNDIWKQIFDELK